MITAITQVDKIIQKMKELNQKLLYHSEKYHREDNPEISDFEYDLLFNQLKRLEEEHPNLVLSDSITQRVGYKIKKGFPPFTHPIEMGSLDNAMTLEEVRKFIIKKNKDLGTTVEEYFLSLKFDGLALELIYQNGRLIVAATRGDGTIGENITHNALQVNNVPVTLKTPYLSRIIIRGEVVMSKQFFQNLNESLEQKGLAVFANPRNATAGTMRQLDENIVKSRNLFFYPYSLANWEECREEFSKLNDYNRENNLDTHAQQMDYIERLGFKVDSHTSLSQNFTKISAFCESIQQKRHDLDYEIDGVVIKINSGKDQKSLGVVGSRPRYAIAWKLPPEIKKTIIEDVIFQVGRTGKITPVAILKPVQIAGVQVRRATLHNFAEIRKKNIHINDTVEVIRSGDVIPKVLGVVKGYHLNEIKEIVFPKNCPVCDIPIETRENGILSYCRNQECPSRHYHNIVHFASKNAFNIEGLGKELIQELMQNGKLKDVGDIFLLQDRDLDSLKRVGTKLKKNLLEAIDNARSTTLARFLYALGITTVGEKTSKILAKKFKTIDNFMNLTHDSLMEIDEVGEVMAENIYRFFSSPYNQRLIKKLIVGGVQIQSHKEDINADKKLYNKKILFTGTLKMPRRRAKEIAEDAGALIISSVSKNLDYLVVGENPGSKKKKAEELNVKIIDESDFLKLIND